MNAAQNPKTNSPKIIKKRLSQAQVRLLEAGFDAARKLEPERKLQLAREVGVPPRQIAIWYQNKRARWRNRRLELDHGALQLRLEAALADKEQLEREVEGLRGELKRAKEMLVGCGEGENQARAQKTARSELGQQSRGGNEGAASSSLNNDDVDSSVGWATDGDLKYEELCGLYLCDGGYW